MDRRESDSEVAEAAGAGAAPALLGLAVALGAAGLLARAGAGPEVHGALVLAAALVARSLGPAGAAAALALVAAAAPALAAAGLAPGLVLSRHLTAVLPAWAFAAGALALLEMRRVETARLRAELRERAEADGLTGVGSRRELLRRGEMLMALARRSGRPLSLLALDVDGLADLNGRHGSELGDEVLRLVATRLRDALRTTDAVGRVDGGRFAVVMPDTALAGARAAAERARIAVAEEALFAPGGGERIRFTVSAGVVELGSADAAAEALLGRADRALAAAKQAGRDRVEVA
ncbi:MAG: GGDEF domain-containing protein [Deltaproteobacteria bacterium]|nr:GGDEF domain-containing protein [Deltaproteobacteria bacterium]